MGPYSTLFLMAMATGSKLGKHTLGRCGRSSKSSIAKRQKVACVLLHFALLSQFVWRRKENEKRDLYLIFHFLIPNLFFSSKKIRESGMNNLSACVTLFGISNAVADR